MILSVKSSNFARRIEVCKTFIRRFDSAPRLQQLSVFRYFSGAVSLAQKHRKILCFHQNKKLQGEKAGEIAHSSPLCGCGHAKSSHWQFGEYSFCQIVGCKCGGFWSPPTCKRFLQVAAALLVSLSSCQRPAYAQDGLTNDTSKAERAFETNSSSKRMYAISVLTLAASAAADSATSWRQREANPILANRQGEFGVSSTLIKAGIVGAWLAPQWWLIKHNHRGAVTTGNFIISGVFGGAAIRNARQK